jgi:hypothetical protein
MSGAIVCSDFSVCLAQRLEEFINFKALFDVRWHTPTIN